MRHHSPQPAKLSLDNRNSASCVKAVWLGVVTPLSPGLQIILFFLKIAYIFSETRTRFKNRQFCVAGKQKNGHTTHGRCYKIQTNPTQPRYSPVQPMDGSKPTFALPAVPLATCVQRINCTSYRTIMPST